MKYVANIGLEVHAELQTNSKMFCSCPVVDSISAEPNSAVCPVCAGMPGVLPVVNEKAVEYGVKVALALDCTVARTSLFARKNYFYPDLPKGYQISQYEFPLAEHGVLPILTSEGERTIRVTRVHLEEDTGKLTHVNDGNRSYSLVDLNRAGVPLLEIVSEPDITNVEEAKAYAIALRNILRYLEVNSGNMEKGVIRFEANISVRPEGCKELGTRVEVKNLNSLRALERSIAYEIEKQIATIESGKSVRQETMGWDEGKGETYSQRGKEDAHDYRYFPEPDLPPLIVEQLWVDRVAKTLPELPRAKSRRFQETYGFSVSEAELLVDDQKIAVFFEDCVRRAPDIQPRTIFNWIIGEIFSWMNQSGEAMQALKVTSQALVDLLKMIGSGEINQNTGKTVLGGMLKNGKTAQQIVEENGLRQISDAGFILGLIDQVLASNPKELASYLNGKETLARWFQGQVMRAAKGQANPQIIQQELDRVLERAKQERQSP